MNVTRAPSSVPSAIGFVVELGATDVGGDAASEQLRGQPRLGDQRRVRSARRSAARIDVANSTPATASASDAPRDNAARNSLV